MRINSIKIYNWELKASTDEYGEYTIYVHKDGERVASAYIDMIIDLNYLKEIILKDKTEEQVSEWIEKVSTKFRS